MRKIVVLSLAAVTLIGAGGVASAQAERGPPATRAEVEQRSVEAFARMDANDDGVLNQADREARRQERFERLDVNDDGEVNPADREARQKQVFDQMDADKSGGISFEEFTALREQRQELRAERGAGPDGQRGRMGMRGRGGRGDGRAADTNNDGTVTQAEFTSASLARFDRVDVDKDGTIDADERPARREWRGRRTRDAS